MRKAGWKLIRRQLTPFVTEAKPKVYGEYPGEKAGPRSAEAYLARWKAENGLD